MPQIRALVVDDSALMRDMITAILSADEDIAVVGQAGNGREAVDLVRELMPDIVTMDIEMPVMNGLEALEAIMASRAVPVLVISARSDSKTAYSAISKGALDVISKFDVDPLDPSLLVEKVKLLATVKVIRHIKPCSPPINPNEGMGPAQRQSESFPVVAIASSTGGPKALSELLVELPEWIPCSIVIAQHISDGFVTSMVSWMRKILKIEIKVGEDREPLRIGTAYVSPSERHMMVGPEKKILLVDREPGDVFRPSCDKLLSSVGSAYGVNSVGVILTGMGNDGVEGLARIKTAGGATIAQDESTSVVFGMPKAAIERGCIDKVLPLNRIGSEILKLVKR